MNQPNNVIDHIARFTSQRDTDLLSFSLLKSVKSMMFSSKSSIITFDNKGNVISQMIYEEDSCIFKDKNIKVDAELIESIQHMNSSSSEEYSLKRAAGFLSIHLLQHDRKSEQFLVLELPEKLAKVQSYILAGILSIYSNFTSLLVESQTDELTGLANRKTFDSSISNIFNDSIRTSEEVEDDRRVSIKKQTLENQKYWLAIIDIDRFKNINDNFGHIYGDEILILLAQIIRVSFRLDDLKFRFGGEEFVVVMSGINQEDCNLVLERFRETVESYQFPNIGQVTVSIGAVELKKDVFHVTSIDYADQALYFSKNNGRNKLTFFEHLLSSGEIKVNEVQTGGIDFF